MRNLTILLSVLVIFLGFGCKGEEIVAVTDGEDQQCADEHADGDSCGSGKCDSGGEEEKALLGRDDPAGTYGMGLTLTELTSVSAILADPDKYWDERVLIKGPAVGVCKKRGCWVEVKGDKQDESIRVKVTDGEIVFPLSCLGNEITVEGVVEKLAVEVEGQDEPRIIWRIRGLGARI